MFRRFTVVVAVGGFFAAAVPRAVAPTTIALAIIPIAALLLAWRSAGRYQLSGLGTDPRPSLAFEIVVPGCTLLTIFVVDPNSCLDWKKLLLGTLVLGLLLAVGVTRADARTKWSTWPATSILFLQLVSACGLIAQTDIHLDRSAPVTYDAVVLRKHVRANRGREYYLDIGPWGPTTLATEIGVRTSVYESAVPGQTVSIALHSGALGIPWYTAQDSNARPSPAGY